MVRLFWVGLLLVGALWVSPAVWAGEYLTEPLPASAPELRHLWRTTIDGIPVSLTNSSRGSLNVPLRAEAATCGEAQMVLTSGRVIDLGMMAGCQVNVFPQLDKFINRDGERLRLNVNGQIREILLTDSDKIGLAQVANQSREAFVLFQQELARVVTQLRPPTPVAPTPVAPPSAAIPTPGSASVPIPGGISPTLPATPLPTGLPPNPPPPAPPTPAVAVNPPPPAPPGPTSGSQDFVIVGAIKEERSGAGSILSVQAINRSTRAILTAQAKFDFFRSNQLVDTRVTAFTPSDVPPGTTASAQVTKADNNWDRVTVSFLWQR